MSTEDELDEVYAAVSEAAVYARWMSRGEAFDPDCYAVKRFLKALDESGYAVAPK